VSTPARHAPLHGSHTPESRIPPPRTLATPWRWRTSATPPRRSAASGRTQFRPGREDADDRRRFAIAAIACGSRRGGAIPARVPVPVLPGSSARAGLRAVVTVVDRDGRLADRSLLRFLGWPAGQSVQFAINPGPIVVVRLGGRVRVNARGHLRLSLSLRQRCRIATADRVLVAADPRRGELLVIAMAELDDMITGYRQRPDTDSQR
jgi:hypothetical protein